MSCFPTLHLPRLFDAPSVAPFLILPGVIFNNVRCKEVYISYSGTSFISDNRLDRSFDGYELSVIFCLASKTPDGGNRKTDWQMQIKHARQYIYLRLVKAAETVHQLIGAVSWPILRDKTMLSRNLHKKGLHFYKIANRACSRFAKTHITFLDNLWNELLPLQCSMQSMFWIVTNGTNSNFTSCLNGFMRKYISYMWCDHETILSMKMFLTSTLLPWTFSRTLKSESFAPKFSVIILYLALCCMHAWLVNFHK